MLFAKREEHPIDATSRGTYVLFRNARLYVPNQPDVKEQAHLLYGRDELSDLLDGQDTCAELGPEYLHSVNLVDLKKVLNIWMPHKFILIDEYTEAAHTLRGLVIRRKGTEKNTDAAHHVVVLNRVEYAELRKYF